MGALNDYLKQLRELIPARTLALYLLGTGLVSGIARTPEEIAQKYGWMILVVTIACLVLNFVGRLVEKKGAADAVISTGAFLMLTLTQRFTGPLAVFGLDSPATYVITTFLAVVYVTVIAMVWHPKQAPGQGLAAGAMAGSASSARSVPR